MKIEKEKNMVGEDSINGSGRQRRKGGAGQSMLEAAFPKYGRQGSLD